jgi:hypothetical protein
VSGAASPLRVAVSHSATLLTQQVAAHYSILNNRVNIEVLEQPDMGALSSSSVAFALLRSGGADAMVSTLTPTAAVSMQAPDVSFFPLWATPFTIVYNIPTIGAPLTLNMAAIARIYVGNITWSDDAPLD